MEKSGRSKSDPCEGLIFLSAVASGCTIIEITQQPSHLSNNIDWVGSIITECNGKLGFLSKEKESPTECGRRSPLVCSASTSTGPRTPHSAKRRELSTPPRSMPWGSKRQSHQLGSRLTKKNPPDGSGETLHGSGMDGRFGFACLIRRRPLRLLPQCCPRFSLNRLRCRYLPALNLAWNL